MTTLTPRNRGKGTLRRGSVQAGKFPPEYAYSANLDYLFVSDGSSQYSGPGTLPRASAAEGTPYYGAPRKRLVDVVMASGIKKRWAVVVTA